MDALPVPQPRLPPPAASHRSLARSIPAVIPPQPRITKDNMDPCSNPPLAQVESPRVAVEDPASYGRVSYMRLNGEELGRESQGVQCQFRDVQAEYSTSVLLFTENGEGQAGPRKRVVEAQYGRLDLVEWECDAESPVTFQDCVKVALHLQALETPISKLFLEVVRLEKNKASSLHRSACVAVARRFPRRASVAPGCAGWSGGTKQALAPCSVAPWRRDSAWTGGRGTVQKLLRGLVEYFAELFVQADLVQAIVPPAVANQRLLQQRWERHLTQVLYPLSATYVQLILGHGLNHLHHMKVSHALMVGAVLVSGGLWCHASTSSLMEWRGRSLKSLGVRDNQIFERLYELAELLVWVTFRRRDRPVIHAEVTRLFRGAHHNHQQQQHQQGDDVANDPSFAAPAAPITRRRTKRGPPLSAVVHESCGLLLRQVPDLSLTSSISVLAGDALNPLTYVSESEGVRGRGLWVLGARRADLNEYLEPAAEEGDQLSLLD
ncbi:hypothetical protein O3P69_018243 [Scylla paramamosain]|uniref:Uncharacterized protein n=1 Tax=Scylla paramamosain TaxID=85552 RepID=A0AAW0TJK7_SCYPA